MGTIKPKQINTNSIVCPKCGATSNFTLQSYGAPTKWASVVHGIEAICTYCHERFKLSENEYEFY